MGLSSLCLAFASIFILSKLVLIYLAAADSLQSYIPTCHDAENAALLQFKQSFVINISASQYHGAYPKTSSWKSAGNQNNSCCSWDGVECDENTGHVIGLDLSSSRLYGSFSSNNTLFSLVHLQSLNLADNNFIYSQIPISIRNFPKLRYLNLSRAYFSGRVPSQVSQLTKLSYLDLSSTDGDMSGNGGMFENGGMFSNNELLGNLAQNLTGLEKLHLSWIRISSTVPNTLANLSNLASLLLNGCDLFGKFPTGIFKLQNLKVLIASSNSLAGQLDFPNNKFIGQIPASFANLTKLTYLSLSDNNISGTIPCSFGNLTQLTTLHLRSNHLSGPIPSSLGNLGKLTDLDLSFNKFRREIPESLSSVASLKRLNLAGNNLSGTVEFLKFLKLPNLKLVDLSDNNLDLITETRTMNASSISRLEYLRLGSCNIREFPNFLRYQDTLIYLNLSWNGIHGPVPKWMWNISRESLEYMDISHNLLSGFDQPPAVLPWVLLLGLDLSFNNLNGPLLVASQHTLFYDISNNNLTGEISPLICNMNFLRSLDLSNNRLSGMLPHCFNNFTYLEGLSVGNNLFHGTLPQVCTTNRSSLKMMDASRNQLLGKLPRSLANCLTLESLVLSSNKFDDVFPTWLGILPELKVLAMKNSGFHGAIRRPPSNHGFPDLRILDLSQNNFTVTLINKGLERYFPKIYEDFMAIDLSSNRFEGRIPELIGNLKGLRSLNVSNNMLTGRIPPSLGNLKNLEALDLSQNKLSGEIPQVLLQLSFLEQFNVSHNNLTGRILHGNQFSTFENTSYEGNPGLCGDPLPKKCARPEGNKLPPSTAEENGSSTGVELEWKFAAAGLVSGLVVGVVLADFVITRWSDRFIEIVALLIRLLRRMRGPRS
ncbi:receptor-like protein 7 isoform X1 [Rosa chinensis]|uniref:receptor-like protein 7 isoform X1 n=1 Tax=Rosa chinensis TaxID=74649 RepID=UPI001AD8E157|nr:receptor-like protein 7 isoform X1 [Rosa chinensis]